MRIIVPSSRACLRADRNRDLLATGTFDCAGHETFAALAAAKASHVPARPRIMFSNNTKELQ
jgi:hypothetical protein